MNHLFAALLLGCLLFLEPIAALMMRTLDLKPIGFVGWTKKVIAIIFLLLLTVEVALAVNWLVHDHFALPYIPAG